MSKAQRTTARAIPRDVKDSLIALALMEDRAHQFAAAAKRYRQRIARRMPSALRLVRDGEFIAAAIREHNERAQAVRG